MTTVASRLPNVKALREELHLTQAQFATKLGCSTRTIIRWEMDITKKPHPVFLMLIKRLRDNGGQGV